MMKVMHLFNEHSLNTHCVLSTILGARDTEVGKKKKKKPALEDSLVERIH